MSKVQDTPSFLFLHRFSSSDYAELTEHSCFTDYARNLNGFGLTAIGLAHLIYSFFVPQISQIYTDLDLFGLWDDADFSSSDYAELSDEKSAKSAKSA